MRRTLLLNGLALAAGASLLQWLEYRRAVRVLEPEVHVIAVAVLFTALGAFVGHRLTRRSVPAPFERNERALDYLRISAREVEVLELLAEGHSNKEMARRLFVSPNTVKTHLAHVYGKLEVSRRTQAVRKARSLRLIP